MCWTDGRGSDKSVNSVLSLDADLALHGHSADKVLGLERQADVLVVAGDAKRVGKGVAGVDDARVERLCSRWQCHLALVRDPGRVVGDSLRTAATIAPL